jgi:L-fuculose-phosphate aldolase
MSDETRTRQEIVEVARLMAQQGLARSSDGNISVRLAPGRILITPRGLYKPKMVPEDLVIVDGEGRLLAAPEGRRPTTEMGMHLEAYRQRPDIQAVLHAHPPHATALTIAGLPYPADFMPEVRVMLGDVPVAPYARPGTPAVAESIRELIRTHDNILLSHHGSISVGRSLEETLMALERMEAAAYTYYLARALGQPVPLLPAELEALADLRLATLRSGGETPSP